MVNNVLRNWCAWSAFFEGGSHPPAKGFGTDEHRASIVILAQGNSAAIPICCSRKNLASAASCSDVGLRSSLACSGTFSPADRLDQPAIAGRFVRSFADFSPRRIHHPVHRRMLPVRHLDPKLRPASLIRGRSRRFDTSPAGRSRRFPWSAAKTGAPICPGHICGEDGQ
jgi:hypothetical protein